MSIFGNLFGVFSLRPEAASKAKHIVPERTRRRVIMLSTEVFSDPNTGNYTEQFWEDIHRLLRFRHGQMQLTKDHPITSVRDDVFRFIMSCPGEEFLDFIEYIFQVRCWFQISYSRDQFVDDINAFFRQGDLPYYLTTFVRQTGRETMIGGPFGGE